MAGGSGGGGGGGSGGGRASSAGSGGYAADAYDVRSGGKTYRHKGRSKSATCKYVAAAAAVTAADSKSKKKKKPSSASRSSNSVSLVSIPNTIKLSMLNSGLLPLCKYAPSRLLLPGVRPTPVCGENSAFFERCVSDGDRGWGEET